MSSRAKNGQTACGRVQLWLALAAGCAIACAAPGCGSTPAEPVRTGRFEARPSAKRFELTGIVVSVDRKAGTVMLDHDDIQGFMRGMRMAFPVKDAWVLDAAKPRAKMKATLVVDGARTWIEGVVLADPSAEIIPNGERGTRNEELGKRGTRNEERGTRSVAEGMRAGNQS